MNRSRAVACPRWLARLWDRVYGLGYGCLRAVVLLLFRPAFLVRRVGPLPALPEGPLLVCANHASFLDPAFVQLVLPRRVVFVMTNDYYVRPWGRWFFRLVAAIPVGAGHDAHVGLRRALARLREGRAVALFPEGRLSRDGSLGHGHRGVSILARMSGATVLPLGIAGAYRAWPWSARLPRRADVRVAFGESISWNAAALEPARDAEQVFAGLVMRRIAEAKVRAEAGPRGVAEPSAPHVHPDEQSIGVRPSAGTAPGWLQGPTTGWPRTST